MTTEKKKVQAANYAAFWKSYAKSKIGKSLNANEKSFAHFYIGFRLALCFRTLGEQEPEDCYILNLL